MNNSVEVPTLLPLPCDATLRQESDEFVIVHALPGPDEVLVRLRCDLPIRGHVVQAVAAIVQLMLDVVLERLQVVRLPCLLKPPCSTCSRTALLHVRVHLDDDWVVFAPVREYAMLTVCTETFFVATKPRIFFTPSLQAL